jgi:hypothetical protein
MGPQFKQREKICLRDDMMVELIQNTDRRTATLFGYVIPLEDQPQSLLRASSANRSGMPKVFTRSAQA